MPVELGGPGGEGELNTNLPEYEWLNRTHVIWFTGQAYTPVADAPQGQFVMTRGVAALGPDAQLELIRRVAAFDGFNADSEPQGWHEMGVIDLDGTTVWFKIDLYDVDYQYGSPEASDPKQTRRVLTLRLPSEY